MFNLKEELTIKTLWPCPEQVELGFTKVTFQQVSDSQEAFETAVRMQQSPGLSLLYTISWYIHLSHC